MKIYISDEKYELLKEKAIENNLYPEVYLDNILKEILSESKKEKEEKENKYDFKEIYDKLNHITQIIKDSVLRYNKLISILYATKSSDKIKGDQEKLH